MISGNRSTTLRENESSAEAAPLSNTELLVDFNHRALSATASRIEP